MISYTQYLNLAREHKSLVLIGLSFKSNLRTPLYSLLVQTLLLSLVYPLYIYIESLFIILYGHSVTNSILLNNYKVCIKASITFVLFILIRFAFTSLSFLYYSFTFIIIISHIYYNSNFFIYFLLYIKDYIKVNIIIKT